jgi:hypothetical protein
MGTGVLGWTEQQTLDTTIPTIMLAHDERRAMLMALFGGGPAADAPPAAVAVTPQAVQAALRGALAR